MSDPRTLNDLYVEELQDLWSANDQMAKTVKDMAGETRDETLRKTFSASVDGIRKHTELLKALVEEAGGKCEPEHCKGMQGLVREARKHALDIDSDGPVKDVAAIAQFQRMSHYGLAGFGTAAAYARSLGKKEAADRLEEATKEIYDCDAYMSDLAERSEKLEAQADPA